MKSPVLLFPIFLAVFFWGTMSAQSIVSPTFSTTGATFSNDEHSIHFSIGEPVNSLLSKDSLRLSQGLIQHLLGLLPSGVTSFQLEGLSVYPNPADNYVTIENERALQNLQYALYRIDGKEIQAAHTLDHLKTTLAVQSLPAGSYILQIINKDQHFQNLNLIKQ